MHFDAIKAGSWFKGGGEGSAFMPLFRTADVKIPSSRPDAPVFQPDGPTWKAIAAPTSLP